MGRIGTPSNGTLKPNNYPAPYPITRHPCGIIRATGTIGKTNCRECFTYTQIHQNAPNTQQTAYALLYPLTYPRRHENGGHLRIVYYIRPYYSAMFSHYPHISQIHSVRANGVLCIRYSVHLHTRKSKRLYQRPNVPERTAI